jgi:hypothetical protein
MLRITTYPTADVLTLKLEGRLAGPWVAELRNCWHQVNPKGKRAIHVNLEELLYVDAEGEKLLAEMYRRGADLLAVDCEMKAVVAAIANRSPKSHLHEGDNRGSRNARTRR